MSDDVVPQQAGGNSDSHQPAALPLPPAPAQSNGGKNGSDHGATENMKQQTASTSDNAHVQDLNIGKPATSNEDANGQHAHDQSTSSKAAQSDQNTNSGQTATTTTTAAASTMHHPPILDYSGNPMPIPSPEDMTHAISLLALTGRRVRDEPKTRLDDAASSGAMEVVLRGGTDAASAQDVEMVDANATDNDKANDNTNDNAAAVGNDVVSPPLPPPPPSTPQEPLNGGGGSGGKSGAAGATTTTASNDAPSTRPVLRNEAPSTRPVLRNADYTRICTQPDAWDSRIYGLLTPAAARRCERGRYVWWWGENFLDPVWSKDGEKKLPRPGVSSRLSLTLLFLCWGYGIGRLMLNKQDDNARWRLDRALTSDPQMGFEEPGELMGEPMGKAEEIADPFFDGEGKLRL